MRVVTTSATISGRPRTGLLVLHYYRLAGQPPVTTLVIIIISMMSSNTFIRQYLQKTIEIDIHTKVLISNEQQSLNFFSESHMFSASRLSLQRFKEENLHKCIEKASNPFRTSFDSTLFNMQVVQLYRPLQRQNTMICTCVIFKIFCIDNLDI